MSVEGLSMLNFDYFPRSEAIPLFYTSLLTDDQKLDNLGDYLSKYMAERISGKPVVKVPMDQNIMCYAGIGSILPMITHDKCIVWGAGFAEADSVLISDPNILALRGPLSYARVKHKVKECCALGDPALLLPLLVPKPAVDQVYDVGIVPHYADLNVLDKIFVSRKIGKTARVINILTSSVEGFIEELCSCKLIVSSSLHGIILAHAYRIPAIWVKFSDNVSGNGFKFQDYFASVSIPGYEPVSFAAAEKIFVHQLIEAAEMRWEGRRILNFNPLPLIKSCPFATEETKNKMLDDAIKLELSV